MAEKIRPGEPALYNPRTGFFSPATRYSRMVFVFPQDGAVYLDEDTSFVENPEDRARVLGRIKIKPFMVRRKYRLGLLKEAVFEENFPPTRNILYHRETFIGTEYYWMREALKSAQISIEGLNIDTALLNIFSIEDQRET